MLHAKSNYFAGDGRVAVAARGRTRGTDWQSAGSVAFLQAAGVRIDRAGSALLYKLHHAKGALRVSELAELLGIDAPSVTRKVQQLERLGYVSIEPDTEDKRAKRVALTPSGNQTLQRIKEAGKERIVRLLEGWSKEEIEELTSSLGKFAVALTKEMENNRE